LAHTEVAARQRGRAIALRLLEKRLRSRAELETALRRRGVPAEDVIAVLGGLRRIGWIDDARFARAWIRDRLALRPSGHRRLRAELLARGVSSENAEDALAALLPGDKEQSLALEEARGRLRRLVALPPVVARRRLVAWLRRRGFELSTIARILRVIDVNGGDGDVSV
jgi:regulatory protein